MSASAEKRFLLNQRRVTAHKVLKGAGFTHAKNCRLVERRNSLYLRNPEIEYDGIDCHLEEVGRQGALLLDVIATPTAEPRHRSVKPTPAPPRVDEAVST